MGGLNKIIIHRDIKERKVGKILTAKELAEYLKLTEVTICKYATEGKIPGNKVGSRWRFEKEKIDALLKNEHNRLIKKN